MSSTCCAAFPPHRRASSARPHLTSRLLCFGVVAGGYWRRIRNRVPNSYNRSQGSLGDWRCGGWNNLIFDNGGFVGDFDVVLFARDRKAEYQFPVVAKPATIGKCKEHDQYFAQIAYSRRSQIRATAFPTSQNK
jgi:hypothetical protein